MTDLDKQEIDTLAKWIVQQGIPTQGPLLAASLLKTAEALRDKAFEVRDHEVRHLIQRYARYYELVGMIEGVTAGGVIDLLRDMLQQAQAEDGE